MARARNIKPGFYKNEQLAECSVWARYIFPGLWMLADREGRLEDRPRRIKAELLPFDSSEIEPLLQELHGAGLILRYEHGQDRYIQVVKFLEHQHPHQKEPPSTIPKYCARTGLAPVKHQIRPVSAPDKNRSSPAEALLPITESLLLNPESRGTTTAPDASRRPPKVNGHHVSFDFSKGAFQGITEDDELQWQEAYPAVPIPPAISQAAAWLKANPANKKSNYERFLVNWFKRDQDKAARVKR